MSIFRRKKRCELLLTLADGRFCGEPAVACCVLFGQHKHICDFHAWDGLESALSMLARTLVRKEVAQ